MGQVTKLLHGLLEDHESLPDSNPESALGPLASPAQHSKLVEVEIINAEETTSCGGGDGCDESMNSCPDSLPKRQQGRKRARVRRQGDHQFKHHRPNRQRHQSDQAGSRGASPCTFALARNVGFSRTKEMRFKRLWFPVGRASGQWTQLM